MSLLRRLLGRSRTPSADEPAHPVRDGGDRAESVYRQAIAAAGAVPYVNNYRLQRYDFIGEGIRQLTGYGPDEITPALWLELVEEATVLGEGAGFTAEEATRRALEGRLVVWSCDSLIRHRDGGTRWVTDTSVRVRDGNGAVMGSVGLLQDVTDRKLAEEQRRRLEEQLAHASKLESVGRLAGGVAHDLNNLLVPILSYAELLAEDLPEDAPGRSDAEEIIRAGHRARDLVRQLLAFARKQTLEIRPLDLNRTIRGIEKMLRRTLRENVALQLRLAPDLPSIDSDVGQIEQVLLNLAVNAEDAMPEGGPLVIETESVELDEAYCRRRSDVTPGRYVMLVVSDAGVGMDRETLARMFEPFFTTKAAGQGTGLGLATVHGIVNQLGGHIHAYSEPGKGATFRLYFPVGRHAAPAEVREEEAPASLNGTETVLVVEDQEQVLDLAAHILERHGYTVLRAADAAAAFRAALEHDGPIHLLLSDAVLPDVDGRKVYERLSATRPEMRVLFMSGYTSDVIGRNGVLDPGVHFLPKPFTVAGLASKVRRVLDA